MACSSEHLQGILDTLPAKPGCYIMKDCNNQVITLARRSACAGRVRSYFHSSAEQDYKTRQLVRNIADIEWIVVASELEALILEMNLIKKHPPRYNIRLKDDKRTLTLKSTGQTPIPK